MVRSLDDQEAKTIKEYRELWADRKRRREAIENRRPQNILSRVSIWMALGHMWVGDVLMGWASALLGISTEQPWRARAPRRKP